MRRSDTPHLVSGWTVLIVTVCVSTLFAASPQPDTMYRSTDFEVHRYWKAVTGTMPLSRWYRAADSVWTLDYPPFFAYVEWCLAGVGKQLQVAKSLRCARPIAGGRAGAIDLCAPLRWAGEELFDPAMLSPTASYPASPAIQRFMRLSVALASSVPLAMAAVFVSARSPARRVWLLAFAAAPSVVLLDLVHLQYNGLVFAFAIVAAVMPMTAGIVAYFVLLMLKHLFAYFVLGYGYAGLTHLAVASRDRVSFVLTSVVALATVIALALAPFVIDEVGYWPPVTGPRLVAAIVAAVAPIKERLFPFGRGLCHAYWAPNLYPLYNVADRMACRLLNRCVETSVNTKGLVTLTDAKDSVDLTQLPTHAVLPSVTPLAALAVVVVSFAGLVLAFQQRRNRSLLLFASAAAFFAGSWHVHEKALLTVLLPAVVGCVAPTTNPRRIGALWQWTRCLALLCTLTISPLFPGVRQLVLKFLLGAAHDQFLGACCSSVEPRRSAPSRMAGWVRLGLWTTVAPAALWVDWQATKTGGDGSFAPLLALSALGSVAFIVVALGTARELGAICSA